MSTDFPAAEVAGISMEGRIRELLQNFADDASASGRALRQLLSADRQGFQTAALSLLNNDLDAPCSEALVSLLGEKDFLIEPLCNIAAFSRERAIAVAKVAHRCIPMLDVKLARKLREAEVPVVERVLALLDAISDGTRIVFMLSHLARHKEPRVRSKAALLIGRTIKKPEWAEEQLRKADARERANAIEALWSMTSPEAAAVFRRAVNDPSRRVAANAMVGLHKLGDPSAVSLIYRMSLLEDPAFRATAAWAMGETGDPRFLSVLGRMNSEPQDIVGRNIARAAERIRRIAAAEGGRLEVRLTGAETMADSSRRLTVAIAAPDKWEPLGLSATKFVVWENSQLIVDYRVEGRARNDALVVGFALCRERGLSEQHMKAAEEAVLACLKHKGATDLWAVVKHPSQFVTFTADKTGLMKAIKGAGPPADETSDAVQVWNRLFSAAGGRGPRSLIALAGASAADSAELNLFALAAAGSKIMVHAIAAGSFTPPHPLEAVCRMTGGIFLAAAAPEQVPGLYQQIYCSLLNRYEVFYRPGPAPDRDTETRIRVQIYSEQGYGEDSASSPSNPANTAATAPDLPGAPSSAPDTPFA